MRSMLFIRIWIEVVIQIIIDWVMERDGRVDLFIIYNLQCVAKDDVEELDLTYFISLAV